MTDRHSDPTTIRSRNPATWILWLAVVIAMLGLATIGFSRYRMWQVKAEVESLGGRLYGKQFPPRWFEWLVVHVPAGRPRQFVAGFRKQFHRVTVIELTGANPRPGLLHRLTCFQFVQNLSLSDCQVHDDDLAALSRLPQLRQLSLGNNPLTDAAAVHFRRLDKLSLVSVQLDHTEIGDDTMRALGDLDSLYSVSVTNTQVSDAGLNGFRDLKLVSLNLANTRITDVGLDRLGRQPDLGHLGLIGTSVTDAGLARLTGHRFPKLASLELSWTNVTPCGVTSLSLPRLSRLGFTCPMTAADWRKLATMPRTPLILWDGKMLNRTPTGGFVGFDRSTGKRVIFE